jgi:hypothetical protein
MAALTVMHVPDVEVIRRHLSYPATTRSITTPIQFSAKVAGGEQAAHALLFDMSYQNWF